MGKLFRPHPLGFKSLSSFAILLSAPMAIRVSPDSTISFEEGLNSIFPAAFLIATIFSLKFWRMPKFSNETPIKLEELPTGISRLRR